MTAAEPRYVPAAGRRMFTRLYDPVIALTMRERTFRSLLLEQVVAGLPAPGGRILDVGCGTGTFAISLTAVAPAAEVTGLDGDPGVLSLAMRKRGAERVTWRKGLATSLPVPDDSVDRVVMSLLLHHLVPGAKRQALTEAVRVLRPDGRLHIADWGRPRDPLARATFLAVRFVDGLEGTRDHAAGRLPQLIAGAGFAAVTLRDRLRTAWGSLELLSAVKPGAGASQRGAAAERLAPAVPQSPAAPRGSRSR